MKSKLVMGIWAAVIAFGLWVYVITAVSPGSEAMVEGVSVSVQGQSALQERGLMIVKNLDPIVDIRLAGNRSDLIEVDQNDISVIVNVAELDKSKADENGVVSLFYTVRVSNDTATVVSSYPDRIRVVVEDRISRDIPVEINYGETKLPIGFEKDAVTLDYQSIPVVGPKSVMDRIEKAEIKVDLTDKKQTLEQTLVPVFLNSDGTETVTDHLKWEIDNVDIKIPIKRVKDIPVRYQVVSGFGATEENTTITVEPAKIRVAGSEAAVEALEYIDIGTVDLSQLLEDTTFAASFTLPQDVSLKDPDLVNDGVRVSVSFQDVMERVYNVPAESVEILQGPQALQMQIVPGILRIVVRGTRSLVEQMTEDSIRVTVNLTGAKVGEESWPVEVTLGEPYEKLAVMEAGTVKIKIEEPPLEPQSLDESEAEE